MLAIVMQWLPQAILFGSVVPLFFWLVNRNKQAHESYIGVLSEWGDFIDQILQDNSKETNLEQKIKDLEATIKNERDKHGHGPIPIHCVVYLRCEQAKLDKLVQRQKNIVAMKKALEDESLSSVFRRSFTFFALNWLLFNALLLIRYSMLGHIDSIKSWNVVHYVFYTCYAMLFLMLVANPKRWYLLDGYFKTFIGASDETAKSVSKAKVAKLNAKANANTNPKVESKQQADAQEEKQPVEEKQNPQNKNDNSSNSSSGKKKKKKNKDKNKKSQAPSDGDNIDESKEVESKEEEADTINSAQFKKQWRASASSLDKMLSLSNYVQHSKWGKKLIKAYKYLANVFKNVYCTIRIILWWFISFVCFFACIVDPVIPEGLRSGVTDEVVNGILKWQILKRVIFVSALVLVLGLDHKLFYVVSHLHVIVLKLWKTVEKAFYKGTKLPRIIVLFLLIAVVSLWFFSIYNPAQRYACQKDLYKEYVGDDANERVLDSINQIVDDKVDVDSGHFTCPWASIVPGSVLRAAHAKTHGCVKGSFIVNDAIPERLRVGVFNGTSGQAFPAWIRFSNANGYPVDDDVADTRGMAVKLMGVDGKRLFDDASEESRTQDLVTISNPTFSVDDPHTYVQFLRAQSEAVGVKKTILSVKYFLGSSWYNPFSWRWKFLVRSRSLLSVGESINNPLAGTYFSTTAYRWGKRAVKYQFTPCRVNPHRQALDEQNAGSFGDYLRLAMMNQLDPSQTIPDPESDDVCFDFAVMEQTEPCLQPIDNPAVEWEGDWVRLATLTIPKQLFLRDDQTLFCESLSFNPWNGLEVHRPLGAINIGRKMSYVHSRNHRNQLNGFPSVVEPTGNETFSSPAWVSPMQGAGNTKDYQFARYGNPFSNMPTMIRGELPAEQKFPISKGLRLLNLHSKVWFHFSAKAKLCTSPNPAQRELPYSQWSSPDDFARMLSGNESADALVRPTPIEQVWKHDWAFAQQYISGVNPVMIRVCKSLPAVFNASLTEEALQRIQKVLADQDVTLEQLMTQKRLFFIDYEDLKDIDRFGDRVFYEPVVLFYLRHEQNPSTGRLRRFLMPLAIMLQRDQPVNRIFTPPNVTTEELYTTQEGRVWLFARMHAVSADANYHESVSHLGLTHLALEPVIVALHRQLASSHPVLKLLVPFTRETLAINDLGRKTLLKTEGSSFDFVTAVGRNGALQLIARQYRAKWSLEAEMFPNRMKAHGFEEVENPGEDNLKDILPGYLYRDYGYKLWHVCREYLSAQLRDAYKSDRDVVHDKQLQALWAELVDPRRADLPGPVPKFDSFEALLNFASWLMFTGSVEHSAVNFGQLDFYSFIPNRPLVLRRPMPEQLDRVTLDYIMKALPSEAQAQVTIVTAATLSMMDDNLSEYVDSEVSEHPASTAYEHFSNQLAEISKYIQERNQKIHVDWPYLDPKQKLATSIYI